MSIKYDDFVKRPGSKFEYSAFEIKELRKCQKSFWYFIKYVKIHHPDKGALIFKNTIRGYQKKFLKSIIKHRWNIALCARQSGKTTAVVVYILWLAMFNNDYQIGIVSNKGSSAKMILARLKKMYEKLPVFLKPGVKYYAITSVEFENGTKIQVSATTEDAFRGETFNCITGDSYVCVINDNTEIFYTEIEKAKDIDTNKTKSKKYYTVYKITNKINNKIYIGFHSTNDLDDGYLGSGKAIKRAIEKYSPENFDKEYIEIFNNKKDAESLERVLVNRSFVRDSDNYNISIGGNVCILL